MKISELSKDVNKFFSTATKQQIEDVEEILNLTELQTKIFWMFYAEEKNAGYIADTFGWSQSKIYNELARIRKKIVKASIL